MISITSSTLRILTKPRILPAQVKGDAVDFNLDRGVVALGSVTFEDSSPQKMMMDGWSIGFLQAMWIDTSWDLYRGLNPDDGSLFNQRGRPPAMPTPACLDHPSDGPFYGKINSQIGYIGSGIVPYDFAGAGAEYAARDLYLVQDYPNTQKVAHFDQPWLRLPVKLQNSLTKQPNYLYQMKRELNFVAVLVVRAPGGRLNMLRGFYWSVKWHNRFNISPVGIIEPVPPKEPSIPVIGNSFVGVPKDQRFLDVLTRPQANLCDRGSQETMRNDRPQQHSDWSPFDLAR